MSTSDEHFQRELIEFAKSSGATVRFQGTLILFPSSLSRVNKAKYDLLTKDRRFSRLAKHLKN